MRRSAAATPLLLAIAIMACSAQSAPPAPPAVASGPPAGYALSPSFAEEFDGPALDTRRWNTAYGSRGGKKTVADRTLGSNGELQVYFDRGYLGLGIDPLTIADGRMRITAAPLAPATLKAVLNELNRLPANPGNAKLAKIQYSSGVITTRGGFQQKYGYFEFRARWSKGKGLWPAFWLLPANGQWPPEIDIMEAHGDKPGMSFQTIHSKVAPRAGEVGKYAGSAQDYHVYGALWLPDRVDYYIDGIKSNSIPTPADVNQPMYMLINLAVGGTWPGNPTPDVVFPATMDVDYVRVWSFDRLPGAPAR